MKALGTLDDLPRDYVAALTDANLVPLWPNLRALLPPRRRARTRCPRIGRGRRSGRSCCARRADADGKGGAARARAREPGRGLDNLQASATIYLGVQLVLPAKSRRATGTRRTPRASSSKARAR
jgi:gentisate 1,2-dioxygenase